MRFGAPELKKTRRMPIYISHDTVAARGSVATPEVV